MRDILTELAQFLLLLLEKDELAKLQEIFYQNVPNSLGVQATTVNAVRSAIKFTKRVLGLNFINLIKC